MHRLLLLSYMASSDGDIDMKTLRREHPSGWMLLTRYQSVPYIIDALLEAPPNREFNKSELARKAGVSTKSVRERIDTLADLGIVRELTEDDNRGRTRYSLNRRSPITQELVELNSAVSRVEKGDLPQSLIPSNQRPHDTDGPSNTFDVSSGDGHTTSTDSMNSAASISITN